MPRASAAGRGGAPPGPVGEALLQDPEAAAAAAGLRYVSDDEPGLERKPWGRGFTYLTPEGEHLKDPEERARIEALAIPPAYTEVWICPRPDGHLLATGRDAEGRKQYVYHPAWRAVRERAKFDHMVTFGEALPRVRRRVGRDLGRAGLERRRVLAAVVRLLERTLIRVGNDEYARENGTYGLTTIRRKHVAVAGERVTFAFPGKGGRDWEVALEDGPVAEVVRSCLDTPGWEVFKYVGADGERRDVVSDEVNEYLRDVGGEDITAKDFRTWAGTVRAACALCAFEACDDETEAERQVVRAIEGVADALRNTPAVCRENYVHPAVIDGHLDGRLRAAFGRGDGERRIGLTREEAAVLAFLKEGLRR